MRLSISTKIFLSFLVAVVASTAVSTYGTLAMRRLGDELRLVSRGYLELRLEVAALGTQQSNLVTLINKLESGARISRTDKPAIDNARRSRITLLLPEAMRELRSLENLRSSPEEHALLNQLQASLRKIGKQYADDERLFDLVVGHIGEQGDPLAPADAERQQAVAELNRNEKALLRDLAGVAADLRLRAQQAALRLEESENRAVLLTMSLAVLGGVISLVVMVFATRAVRPLRRLAERAKHIARGDYKQRVDATTNNDEIGALGREFNAMAAALEEREQQLIRSERLAAVGKIAAQITHEVRNPLSSIGLNAELLEEIVGNLGDGRETEEAKALVRAIGKEVDRLTDITEEYLRFARLPRPRLSPEQPSEILRAVTSFVRPELERAGVALVVEVPALPTISADEHQLRQALVNLLRNAKEAMPSGGTLTVAARVLDDFVEIRIHDTGPGIPAEHLGKIFDPFFSTKERGTGLGLALTHQIVGEHGGSIAVDSAAGSGTAFRIRLPIAPPAAAAEAPALDAEAKVASAPPLAPVDAHE